MRTHALIFVLAFAFALTFALFACGGRGSGQAPASMHTSEGSYPSAASGPDGYQITPSGDATVGGAPNGPRDAGAPPAHIDAATGSGTTPPAPPAGPPPVSPNPNENPHVQPGLPPTPTRLDGGAVAPGVGDAGVPRPPVQPY